MYKTIFAFSFISVFSTVQAQNTFPPTGSTGIGIAAPTHLLQISGGTTTYTSPQTFLTDAEGVLTWVPGTAQGYTAKYTMTNNTTGNTATDGTMVRQSGANFVVDNLERGNVTLQSNRAFLTLNGGFNRISVGEVVYVSQSNAATFNITGKYDNGLQVVNAYSGYFGISAKVVGATDKALILYGNNASPSYTVLGNGVTELYYRYNSATAGNLFTIRNNDRKLLQVTNDGILRSREIIVDGLTWADYVFQPNYYLMPLDSVRAFIAENGRLPNVPSTAEVTEEGVNVAKTDAMLLQKIEELTLYVLQQQEQMKILQAEVEALKKAEE